MPKRNKKNASSQEKKKKKKNTSEEYEYVSDDERLYGDQDPDPESREYFYDDIDEFHAKRDKILIEGGVQEDDSKYLESEEEEVLGLDSSDSDDDEIRELKSQLRRVQELRKKSSLDSDLEDNVEEEEDADAGLPDSRAWGKKRKKYYGEEDIVLSDVENEEGNAALEEQEALKLQRQMAEQLDDQDFGLDIFKPSQSEKDTSDKEQKIVKDLSKLSKREKLQLLKKESPELLTLIEEFKEKLTEVQEKLDPLRMLIQDKQIKGPAADYIHTKFKLNLNYCINILFYLVLKAKQVPVHNHPVIKRLLQHRNLLKQLEPVDIQLKDEITDILSHLSAGEDVTLSADESSTRLDRKTFIRRQPVVGVSVSGRKKKLSKIALDSDDEGLSDDIDEEETEQITKQVKKAKKSDQYETKDEQAAIDYYKMMKRKGAAEASDDDDDDEVGVDDGDVDDGDAEEEEMEGETGEGKRAISYQIEKNKGLTVKKKKELRNPRVKHRMKFKKAKIRRKGQIREVRTEMNRYAGEISGIRAGIKRGIKLK